MFAVLVMMLMVMVMAAAAMLVMLMMMLMVMAAAAMFAVLMMMLMVMVMVTAGAMLMVFMMHLLQCCQLHCQSRLAFHGGNQLRAGELTPGCCDDGCLFIMGTQHFHSGIQLGLGNRIGTGQDDGGSSFDLIVVELTEVLHIDLDLACINDRDGITQCNITGGNLLHRTDHIRQLANAGRLNDNPVGMILGNDLFQCLAKVAYQRAADTAGVHLGNVDARILQETAVNADLAKFIFDEHQLLTCVSFLDHLLDQCGFTRAEETRINVNFHKIHLLYINFLPYSIPCIKPLRKGIFCISSTAFDGFGIFP